MTHILINGNKYSLDTAKEFEAALAAMPAEEIAYTVRDDDSDQPTGEVVSSYFDPKAIALAAELGCSPLIVDECAYGDDMYESTEEPGEYRVLTDSERDSAWDESLESYIDDCILAGESEVFQRYFDRDAWKRDARIDGAGHSLASYDSEEREAQIDGQWYFIYRVG